MDTMKAVVYRGKEQLGLVDRPMPKILAPEDAIVRVTRSTICSSDLHILHGSVPRAKEGVILGHEFVGVVTQVGTGVKKCRVGERVAVNVETFCGDCFYCRRGFVNNCEKGGWELGCRIDGCQAEFVRVPLADQGLHPIPDTVSDEDALLVGDVLSTGYWAAQIGEIEPASTVAVLGAGPTGLCTMMCARLYSPACIVAIDVNDERLSLARANGLCDIALNPARDDVEARLQALTEGRGADRVFEVAGAKDTFEMAWRIARPSAIVVLVALYPEAQSLPLHLMYGKNLTFKTGGVHANACGDILRLIEAGRLDTSCLLTHRAPLNDVLTGYRTFESMRDGCIKWVITPYER
ncbi:MAG: alcohol dehydrogenase [Clostridia bacterium]|nr:alcohol dehydrogenase [Clostridia bacterium]